MLQVFYPCLLFMLNQKTFSDIMTHFLSLHKSDQLII